MIAMIVMDAKNVNQSKLYIMSIPKNYLPFDVNVALSNPERVISRNGKKRFHKIYVTKDVKTYPLVTIALDNTTSNYTIDGNFNIDKLTEWDLFLLAEEKDVKTLHREKNIAFMMELGFEVKPMSSVGYSVYKDGVKLSYCSYNEPLQNLAKLIELHVIPYYEKRAFEKGQNNIRESLKKILEIKP